MVLRKFSQPSARLLLEKRHVQVAAGPHSLSATYFRWAATSIRADLPSGKVPTTRVLRLISLLSRSIALFVRMRRQCSRGIPQYASVSAYPSRTTLAASLSRIDSRSSATASAVGGNLEMNRLA